MKPLSLIVFAVLLIGDQATSAVAVDCVKLPQVDLATRLSREGFPSGLLSKVHAGDVARFGDFVDCPPTWFPHATAWIYAQHAAPYPRPWEDLSFMVFEFPSSEARDKAIAEGQRVDGDARTNKDDKVVYYLEPNSRKAFRVELWRGQPIE